MSVSVCNSLPAVSVSLCKSTLPKVDKGLQGVLAKSGHKEAIWKEAVEGHQVERLTLDKRCIITLVVICVILIGLMWYHIVSKVNILMEFMSRCGPTPSNLRALK